jgi:hypothetical protein
MKADGETGRIETRRLETERLRDRETGDNGF